LFVAGQKDMAIQMYRKGIDELEKGIAVTIIGEGLLFTVKWELKRSNSHSPSIRTYHLKDM